MLTRRRVIVAIVVLLLAAVAYTAWLLYVAQRDLRSAEAGARELRAAIEAEDDDRAQAALDYLQKSAESANDATDGLWWGAMTLTPVYGDDLAGVRALTASLEEVASEAAPALLGLTDQVDTLVVDGAVDLPTLDTVADRVEAADDSLARALDEVDDRDSSGFVAPLRERYDDFVELVSDTSGDIDAARIATDVAPTMLGADGPRDYLLVFQNNAEIRSTGGISGSWARVHSEDGKVELMEQGSSGDFPSRTTPVAPLSEEENAVYGDVIARFFQNPLVVPDFPRSAELFDAFWQTKYPDVDLDGVMTLDTVGLSYLLRATGPVTTDGYTLTPDTVVQQMLNQVYLDIEDPKEQDAVFTRAASKIFTAVTSDIQSPTELVRAVNMAASERRLLISSFEDKVSTRLAGTAVAGEFRVDDGGTTDVDITVNDATGSKMSYYLDYDVEMGATSCQSGVQELSGSMTIRQTLPAAEARKLPVYITGGGTYGVEIGSQQVQVRIYAPTGGTLGRVNLDGLEMPRFAVTKINDREVITLTVLTDGSKNVVIDWDMSTGPDQPGEVRMRVTPKVTPGSIDRDIATAC